MDNEVEIVVKAKDDTQATFMGITERAKALKARIKVGVDVDKDRVGTMLSGIGPMIAQSAGSIGSSISSALGPTLMAALVPIVATALTAAIPLAFGGGVLALGIIGALKDPKIASALGEFGDKAKSVFAKFSEPFKGPVLRAINTFSDALDEMEPSLVGLGSLVAPVVDKLAPAVAEFAKSLLPGIQKAVEASMPLFDILADKLPEIGEAVSKFLEVLTDEEAMEAAQHLFSTLLDGVTTILPWIARVIAFLARFYSAMVRFWSGVKDTASEAVSDVRSTLSRWGSALQTAWNRVSSFVTNAINAFRRLPGGIRSGIMSAISAATGALNSLRSRIVGFFGGAGSWLVGAGRRIISGLLSGIRSAAGSVMRAVRSVIPDQLEGFLGFAHGGIVGAASGGARSGLTMVGEHGRELVKLPAGSQVYPNEATERMLGGEGRSGGSTQVVVEFAGNLDSAFATAFMKMQNAGLITFKQQYVRG